jgi:hypothetical protein
MMEVDRWWENIPSKRVDTYRHIPLEHVGAAACVNDCVITRAHDRTLPLRIKMFLKENVAKRSFSNVAGNNNDVASGWERPRSIMDVHAALANFADVMAALWPQDPTARILNRVLILYEYGMAYESSERERCRLIEEFCDAVMRENARRAVTSLPPLSAQQAKERWRDLVELRRSGNGGRSTSSGRGDSGSASGARVDRRGAKGSGGYAAGGSQQGAKGGGLTRSTTVLYGGNLICYHFNNVGRGCTRQLKGPGCDNGRGGFYAHVCNYEFPGGKFCFAKHPRHANH